MTESARSRQQHRLLSWNIITISLGIVLLLGFAAAYGFVKTRGSDEGITMGGTFFRTEVVSSLEARARGLSGRDRIDSNYAMVFDSGSTKRHCMWMKDMKFAIDIVWLDDSRKIVAIERNVAPETYPKSFCHEGKTVVELAAGTADRIPLSIGDSAK